jgi:hypothetical protein
LRPVVTSHPFPHAIPEYGAQQKRVRVASNVKKSVKEKKTWVGEPGMPPLKISKLRSIMAAKKTKIV